MSHLLPASGWKSDSTGQTFKYMKAPQDPSPIKAVTLKNQRAIKVTGKGSGIIFDQTALGSVEIFLVVGEDAYCSLCDVPTRDEPGLFVASRCPAPPSCDAICGNGVIDTPFEECDGSDQAACGPSSECTGSCDCCGLEQCGINTTTGLNRSCCTPNECQLTHAHPFSAALLGVCIPPTCSGPSDCNGYACVDGKCCASPGGRCGTVDCCPGTGSTCVPAPDFGSICCLPPGSACEDWEEPSRCCSQSCTGSVCD